MSAIAAVSQSTPIKRKIVHISDPSSSTTLNTQWQKYLFQHLTKNTDETRPITNTRIPDKESRNGGSYHIPSGEYDAFLQYYGKLVFQQGFVEHLTEKQLETGGPLLVDVDLHYSPEVEERIHTEENIRDFIDIYLYEITQIFDMNSSSSSSPIQFPVYVLQKPHVNRIPEKQMTKDGIHMIIGIKMEHSEQLLLRQRVMSKLSVAWSNLPVINSWEEILDRGISAGHCNWQLIGSCKPGHEPYCVTHIFQMIYDPTDGEFQQLITPMDTDFNIMNHLPRLSARYRDHISLPLKPESATAVAAIPLRAPRIGGGGGRQTLKIQNREQLEDAIRVFEESIQPTEYDIKEAYDYTMILPPIYYQNGAYDKWVRVGFALRNVSDRLFVVWVAFSAQNPTFNFTTEVDMMRDKWLTFDVAAGGGGGGLTIRSLRQWAKSDATPADYKRVSESTLEYYMDQTLNSKEGKNGSATDYDLARVLYYLYKDEYKCVSVKNGAFYKFVNHRWTVVDDGTYLRLAISNQLRELYRQKSFKLLEQMVESPLATDTTPEEQEKIKKIKEARLARICEISRRLATHKDKMNIMSEAKDLFYDSKFFDKLDADEYLLGCNNGVVDFRTKTFRAGLPDDYLSKSTGIDYIPLVDSDPEVITEIHDFMSKLFPIPELREYMWEFLASCVMGKAENQTFNMWIGMGQNGKSKLCELMDRVLGEYAGSVPLALITDERPKIGGLSPEMVALKGVRLAVMQEPSKGQKIREGPLKQLTGGDPVTCRAPFQVQMTTYRPQFKLIVCSNEFLDIKAQDHGTWRRIRVVDFVSLFTENPVSGDVDKPYQFKLDKKIDSHFEKWKSVFLSMLVEKAFQTGGEVHDCDMVMKASREYKAKQDCVAGFLSEKIVSEPTGSMSLGEVNRAFETWYTDTYGKSGRPQNKELHEYLDKHLCRRKDRKWTGYRLREEEMLTTELI